MTRRLIFPASLFLLLLSRAPAQTTFTDVTDSAATGLGEGTSRAVAWNDFNRDGWPDLFVPTSGTSANKLYMNNRNGTFREMAAAVGLDDFANTITATWGDFDNDGDADLLTTATGAATRLWRNNRQTGSDTSFTSIEGPAGISITAGQMASWADYNGDGFLDVFIPVSGSTATDALYRNNGNATFTNVADSAGVNHPSSSVLEQAVHWGDYDRDGDPDLFIGNLQTSGQSYLHRNNGNGTFTEIAGTLGFMGAGRGAQWVDYNNDGLWDFSHAGYAGGTTVLRPRLFRNNGNGTFTSVDTVFSDALIAWGLTWGDYDNNGYEDLYVYASGQSTASQLYRNNGDGTFTNVTTAAGLPALAQLAAGWADQDNDGDLDLYTAGTASLGNHLYRNNGTPGRHWLKVRLAGIGRNAGGIGARVSVRAGSLRMMREPSTGIGYRSQNSPVLHFGLGTATIVDSLVVDWPSGRRSVLAPVPADREVLVAEPLPLQPRISVRPDTLRLFGPYDSVVVRNVGLATLLVDSARFGPGVTALGIFPERLAVQPGDSGTFIVSRITGNSVLVDTATLFLFSNDPVSPRVAVPMRGTGFTSTSENTQGTPGEFALLQNYPNPFNPATVIRFSVQGGPGVGAARVRLAVYDLLGREVAVPVNGVLPAGAHSVTFDGAVLPSGVYLYRLTAAGRIATKAMVLVK